MQQNYGALDKVALDKDCEAHLLLLYKKYRIN